MKTMYQKHGQWYLKDDEKELLPIIAPCAYADAAFSEKKELPEELLIAYLQNELKDTLQSFLNGGFSTIGYVTYPLIKDLSVENQAALHRIGNIASSLKKQGHDISPNAIEVAQKATTSLHCVHILSEMYEELDKLPQVKRKATKKKECESFDIKNYDVEDQEYLAPLNQLQKYAQKHCASHVKGFYVHGSLATNDFIKGWSDCDTLAIISNEAIENPSTLKELRDSFVAMRRFYYQIDPLQHHGTIMISESDLKRYPQAYFPLPLFSYAKAFILDSVHDIWLRDDRHEAHAKLFWIVNYFRMLKQERKYRMGSYEIKNLLHQVALLPSLYLQAKGVHVYKKFSFEIAAKDFPPELWEPVQKMTLLRTKWTPFPQYPLIKSYASINPITAYQLNAKIMDISGVLNKYPIDTKQIIDQMHSLCEDAWSKVKKVL